MKKLTLVLILFLSFLTSHTWSETLVCKYTGFTCPEITIDDFEDLVVLDGLYYKKFTDTPFTGKVISALKQGYLKDGKKEGSWVDYYEDGQLESKGNYKDGKKEGTWFSYWNNRQLEWTGNYKNDKMDGYWVFYYDNARLREKGEFINGIKEGTWVGYLYDGNIDKSETGTYKNGAILGKYGYLTSPDLLTDKTTIVTNKKELSDIQKDYKHFYPVDADWRTIKPKWGEWIKTNTQFEPSEIKFIFDEKINGILISGTIIPRFYLSYLNTNWGSALVRFTRESDGKFFDLFAEKILLENGFSLCQGQTSDNYDLNYCKLASGKTMIIKNNNNGATFSFKDIDYDGIEELIFNTRSYGKNGDSFTAYNIINTKEEFRLENSPNQISVEFFGQYKFVDKEKLLVNIAPRSCCIADFWIWKAIKGSYRLVEYQLKYFK